MVDGSGFVIVILLAVAIWLIFKLRQARRERERLHAEKDALNKAKIELEAENALLTAEHLKFQLQPHTLNNILANLKTIASKLSRGMDSLSSTLDYILYKGKTHLVSVEDEVGFIETYLKLNDLFLTELDAIKINTDEIDRNVPQFTQPAVPHLISACFIENAFKHGDKDHPEFLSIRIKLTHNLFQLHVSNRVKHKPQARLGGLGLHNMKERLELLMAGRYDVKTSNNHEEYHAILTIQFQA